MQFLHVTEVTHQGSHKLHLVFNDGSSGYVDLENHLNGPIFRPLQDEALFSQARLDGGTVAWPNGADLAPEYLREHLTPLHN